MLTLLCGLLLDSFLYLSIIMSLLILFDYLLPNNLRTIQYMHILTLHRMLLQKDDGQYVGEGDTIRPNARPKLTATLRAIVENGFDEFYTGTTATNLRSDISRACAGCPYFCRKLEHIITSEDLAEYEVKTRAPFKFSYDANSGYDVYTAPAPYGGPALAVFLGIVTSKYMYMQNILTYLINAISGCDLELEEADQDSITWSCSISHCVM